MELMNPNMTIQNTDGPHWLVCFEHEFGDGERIVVSVKVLKSDHPLVQIQREAFDRATELLQIVSTGIQPST